MLTQLIEGKIKFGRALSALSRHNHVLNNGLLPSQSLEERASIAHGIVEDRISRGMVGEAINLLYSEQSQARLLFGADSYPQFRQLIIDRLKSGKKVEVDKKALQLLKAKDEEELLYNLLLHADFSTDIIYEFIKDTPQDERSKLLTKIGMLELREGEFDGAYRYFKEVDDQGSLKKLFEAIKEEPLRNIELGEEVAGDIKDDIGIKTRLKQLYFKFLQRVRKDPTDVSGLSLFAVLYKAIALDVKRIDPNKMLDIIASKLSHYELTEGAVDDGITEGKSSVSQIDPSFPLRWARHHCSTDPQEAYTIFKEAKYNGKEVIKAVITGLTLDGHQSGAISPRDILPKHLSEAYPKASLEVKCKIASTLKDPKKLQALSREYRKRKDFEKSYRLWIKGNGDLNDRTFVDTRRRIIDKEFKNPYISHYCLDDKDIEGNRTMFNRFMQKESYAPHRAYEIAVKIKDADLTQRARVEMVKRNPAWALEIFKEDPVGVDLALTSLETRYGVPREQLNEILALPTK